MKQFHFQKIKQYRTAAGLTQEQLAEMIGVMKQQVSAWENSDGDKSLTTVYLGRIAHALGRATDDFFVEGA